MMGRIKTIANRASGFPEKEKNREGWFLYS